MEVNKIRKNKDNQSIVENTKLPIQPNSTTNELSNEKLVENIPVKTNKRKSDGIYYF
jgi:hypothetical protein